MKGDFSRSTFEAAAHRRNTLLQQGRVLLDATWNEQQELTQYRAETAAADTLGATGGPAEGAAFWLDHGDGALTSGDFRIGPGRYYVDGMLCENEQPTTYRTQPDLPGTPALTAAGTYLVYLDVWLRHLTALEDPRLRERALGGADADTRVKVVWQVKTVLARPSPVSSATVQALLQQQQQGRTQLQQLLATGTPVQIAAAQAELDAVSQELETLTGRLTAASRFRAWTEATAPGTGTLAARTRPMAPDDKPCLLPPAAGYQGLENQLYRVEIHQPGAPGTATFKWSRDNGAAVILVQALGPQKFAVVDGLQGGSIPFVSGDWAELIDDARELHGQPGEMVRVKTVDPAGQTILLETIPTTPVAATARVKLRQWNSASAVTVPVPPASGATWVPLEHGIEVRFGPGTYRTGDYWLIPARTADADIEWPRDDSPPHDPLLLGPRGVQHHYARLAFLTFDGAQFQAVEDLRNLLPPLIGSVQPGKVLVNLDSGREVTLRPGMEVRSDWLARGFYLALDRPVDPQTLSPAACALTVELPFPGTDQERQLYGNAIIGYQPIVLAADLHADAFGGLRWQPTPATRDLLLRGLPAGVRRLSLPFVQDWEIVDPPTGPPGKWEYASNGAVTQTSRNAGEGNRSSEVAAGGRGTVALFRQPLPNRVSQVTLTASVLSGFTDASDVGLILHWRDPGNYVFFFARSYGQVIGYSGFQSWTSIQLIRVENGQWIGMGGNPQAMAATQVKLQVKQVGNRLEFSAQLAGMLPGPLTNPIVVTPSQPVPQFNAGTRFGLMTRYAAPITFSDLEIAYADGSPSSVLLPGGGSERALARLTLRRNLLRSRDAAEARPRFSAEPLPQADFETWFWLVNPPGYYSSYGGSAGIGVGPLLPG